MSRTEHEETRRLFDAGGVRADEYRAQICPPGFTFYGNTQRDQRSYKDRIENWRSQPDLYQVVDKAWDENGKYMEGWSSIFTKK